MKERTTPAYLLQGVVLALGLGIDRLRPVANPIKIIKIVVNASGKNMSTRRTAVVPYTGLRSCRCVITATWAYITLIPRKKRAIRAPPRI